VDTQSSGVSQDGTVRLMIGLYPSALIHKPTQFAYCGVAAFLRMRSISPDPYESRAIPVGYPTTSLSISGV
jgi:hypothetical protein